MPILNRVPVARRTQPGLRGRRDASSNADASADIATLAAGGVEGASS